MKVKVLMNRIFKISDSDLPCCMTFISASICLICSWFLASNSFKAFSSSVLFCFCFFFMCVSCLKLSSSSSLACFNSYQSLSASVSSSSRVYSLISTSLSSILRNSKKKTKQQTTLIISSCILCSIHCNKVVIFSSTNYNLGNILQ